MPPGVRTATLSCSTEGPDLPPDTLVDADIVISDADGRWNFGALQQRLGRARRDAAQEAKRSPAVLLAFDPREGTLGSNSSISRFTIDDTVLKCCSDQGARTSSFV